MARWSLIHRGRAQRRFARMVTARQPLARLVVGEQRIPRALGPLPRAAVRAAAWPMPALPLALPSESDSEPDSEPALQSAVGPVASAEEHVDGVDQAEGVAGAPPASPKQQPPDSTASQALPDQRPRPEPPSQAPTVGDDVITPTRRAEGPDETSRLMPSRARDEVGGEIIPRRAAISERPAAAADERPTSSAQPRPANWDVGVSAQPEMPPEAEHAVTSADDLFLPRTDTDRTPQTWAARLTQAATAEATAARKVPAQLPALAPVLPVRGRQVEQSPRRAATQGRAHSLVTPLTLSEPARRFLKPLVGADPAAVRAYQGPRADQVAAALEADAIAVGEDVAIATSHADESPEALGLLAHELTHVARARQPDFVPPVARPRQMRFVPPAVAPVSPASEGEAPLAPSDGESVLAPQENEETLALRTERRVIRAARARAEAASATDTQSAGGGAPTDPSLAARDVWSGLPAPWEPLPDWLAASPVDVAAPARHGDAPRITMPTPPAAPVASLPSSAPPGAHLAAQGRDLGGEAEEAAASVSPPLPPPADEHAPEPDLDALARQVHAILRRRLAAERRREG